MSVFKIGAFPQKITERFDVEGKIKSIAVSCDGTIYACAEEGLVKFVNGTGYQLFADGSFTKVYCDKNGRVFASKDKTVYQITDNGAKVYAEFNYPVVDLKGDNKLYVLTVNSLHVEDDDEFFTLQEMEQTERSLAVSGDKVCVASELCLQRMEGKRRTWRCIFPAHSTMPEIHINAIEFDKNGYLLVGADEGLFIYDYKCGWYSSNEISA